MYKTVQFHQAAETAGEAAGEGIDVVIAGGGLSAAKALDSWCCLSKNIKSVSFGNLRWPWTIIDL